MSIGSQIKLYRNKLNLKYRELGDACNMDGKTISALEKRDSNRSDFFPAIAAAFGLTVEQLADESKVYDVRLVDKTQQMVTPIDANRPVGLWPFKKVTPAQYDLLEDDDRVAVENHILLFLQARASPAYQAEPAIKSLSA
jgi:transcriptional regulator with XRE-family HTH domain